MHNPKITEILAAGRNLSIRFDPFEAMWATHRWADIRPQDRRPLNLVWRSYGSTKHCRKCGAIYQFIHAGGTSCWSRSTSVAAFYLPGEDVHTEPISCNDSMIHGIIV